MELQISEKITICLNMIVKNESKIITRLFDSVLPLIDTYCICDTGSTDDTKKVITDYFDEKKITGTIFDCSFNNFGYNRTVALHKARNTATYLLLMDADMKMDIRSDFNKQDLTADVYSIQQGSNTFKYFNTRLVKSSLDIKCVGPTHEYYDLPPNTTTAQLRSLFIADIGDGGCKDNKFSRDIVLLKDGLIKEPNNGRYYFYLANSYYNSGKITEALPIYKKRIEVGGWREEVWYSYYRLGLCYKNLNQIDKAIKIWLDGYDYYPRRAENIYEIVKHYRIVSKHKLAYHFYKLGKSIPLPADNVLFLHYDVYDFLFDYELSVIAYYLSPRPDVLSCYMKLFNSTTNLNNQNIFSNFKFYCKSLSHKISHDFNNPNCFAGYKSTTPSIIPYKNGFLSNIRYVDYHLNNNGEYTYKDGYNVHTHNEIVLTDAEFNILERTPIDFTFNEQCRIRGIEDIKILEHNDQLYFIGTKQVIPGHKLCLCYGAYDISNASLDFHILDSPTNADCEKNWALFSQRNKLRCVYKWNPLMIGEIKNNIMQIIQKEEGAPILRHLRGSSNGFLYNEEYWFVCHAVEYSSPRHYYHCIVILDGHTLQYKRHSRFFTFAGEKIEFCLSIIIRETTIVMSHSCWDRTSEIKIYNKDELLKDIFNY